MIRAKIERTALEALGARHKTMVDPSEEAFAAYLDALDGLARATESILEEASVGLLESRA